MHPCLDALSKALYAGPKTPIERRDHDFVIRSTEMNMLAKDEPKKRGKKGKKKSRYAKSINMLSVSCSVMIPARCEVMAYPSLEDMKSDPRSIPSHTAHAVIRNRRSTAVSDPSPRLPGCRTAHASAPLAVSCSNPSISRSRFRSTRLSHLTPNPHSRAVDGFWLPQAAQRQSGS